MEHELTRIVTLDYVGTVNAELKDEDLDIYYCPDTNEVIILNADGATCTIIKK